METISSAIDEWRTADRRAREAEARLRGAWNAHRYHDCDPPAPKLRDEAALLRARAEAKLKEAMQRAGVTGHAR
jgi:hypothetical protein